MKRQGSLLILQLLAVLLLLPHLLPYTFIFFFQNSAKIVKEKWAKIAVVMTDLFLQSTIHLTDLLITSYLPFPGHVSRVHNISGTSHYIEDFQLCHRNRTHPYTASYPGPPPFIVSWLA